MMLREDWSAGDIDDLANGDALDDVRGETRDTIREARLRSAAAALAWDRLMEMQGELRRSHLYPGAVNVQAPTGEVALSCDVPTTLYEYGDDPDEVVAEVHRQWVALGRPAWPVEVEVTAEEHPDAEGSEEFSAQEWAWLRLEARVWRREQRRAS